MTNTLLVITALNKRFDGVTPLDDFSCSVREGEIVGVIGPNGAGKTTLFNTVTGFVLPDAGSVTFRGTSVVGLPPHKVATLGISRTFQDLRLIRQMSALDNILLACKEQPGERLSRLFLCPTMCARFEERNRESGLQILSSVGLSDTSLQAAGDLSYGQQKLLSLACCLAAGAQLLLLDEPFAGVAPGMIERMLEIIRDLPREGKTAFIIEHNIDAVAQVCDRLIVMSSGRKLAEGTPEQVRGNPEVVEAYLGG